MFIGTIIGDPCIISIVTYDGINIWPKILIDWWNVLWKIEKPMIGACLGSVDINMLENNVGVKIGL